MASKNLKKEERTPQEWPRIREISVRGARYYQVDGRPTFKRRAFLTLAEARKQADRWRGQRQRYGTAGRFIADRDATQFAQALDILAPHGRGIVDAARHFADYLSAEKLRTEGMVTARALEQWAASYNQKDRDVKTKTEIRSVANLFRRSFGDLRLNELTSALLLKWLQTYEVRPGVLASPQTRANFRTKLSQFLNFCRLHTWIERNPLDGIKVERPPRAAVAIFELTQVRRVIAAAEASIHREIVLPYVVICFFGGLRPASEAEQLRWQDVHFATGDIHVRGETSKTREERFVPTSPNLRAWLDACPVRHPGPVIGSSYTRFREAWEGVKRVAGYRVGAMPEGGWSNLAMNWPADGMRHTFASMWLALHKSRAELAEHMGNSESTIKSHYRRAIREDVARAFWAIVPQANGNAKIVRMPEKVA